MGKMGKNTRVSITLILGDFFVLASSLWFTLFIRNLQAPSIMTWVSHFLPFIVIFILSGVVFLVYGLYERNASGATTKLLSDLFYAQIANTLIAISFFYFVPVFGINPKLSLFLYIAISFVLMSVWRVYGKKFFEIGYKDNIILVGNAEQIEELSNEFEKNKSLKTIVAGTMDVEKCEVSEIAAFFRKSVGERHDAIVADVNHPKIGQALSEEYDFLLSNISICDINQLYESVFMRVSVQSINYSWIVEVNKKSYVMYDFAKRILDLVISVPLALVTFPFFPLVALVIRAEGKGAIFITQDRVGKNGKMIRMYKFRSMTHSDGGAWLTEKENPNKVTKVGYVLRKTRIDEFPQLINVIKGDISLIGPRPDIGGLGQKLMTQIPYYMTRYSVLPGLSGWAQIHQIPPQSVEETKIRFSYDLYYVKHRSIFLDIRIALRTIYELLSRNGM